MSRMLAPIALLMLLASVSAGAESLSQVLAAQPEEVRARYAARHPGDTLEFFGIGPGQTVVELLPGRGWYSRILVDWLGADGRLIGADYALDMYPRFNFYDDAFLAAKKTWVEDWSTEARGWAGDDGAAVDAFVLGTLPERLAGSADAVLMIRALHNLARFEHDGGYLTTALADVWRVLKPGGVLGVVQHMAPETASDAWADGSNGYLKRSFVIVRLSQAGFEYVGSSDVNRNPADQPSENDFVWRLPPSLSGSEDDPDQRARMQAIGESDRMTLLFRKPSY